MASIYADARNYYDRLHHAIIMLCYLTMCVPLGAIKAMLRLIYLMKFFLRTGWGKSSRYIGGNVLRILQGLCQGNGVAPGSWHVLSLILIRMMKHMGHEAVVTSPISNKELQQ